MLTLTGVILIRFHLVLELCLDHFHRIGVAAHGAVLSPADALPHFPGVPASSGPTGPLSSERLRCSPRSSTLLHCNLFRRGLPHTTPEEARASRRHGHNRAPERQASRAFCVGISLSYSEWIYCSRCGSVASHRVEPEMCGVQSTEEGLHLNS